MQNDDKDKIDRLRDMLYSPNSPDKINAHRRKLDEKEFAVQEDWQGEKEDGEKEALDSSPLLAHKKRGSMKLLIFFSLFFFLICAGIAGYVYFSGLNDVSTNRVDITFNAPTSAPAGEPLTVNMDIANTNSESLLLSDVTITYPDGSRQAADVALPITSDLISVGTIASGQTVQKSFSFVPFGDESENKDVLVTLDYRIAGSNAVFEKKKTYEVSLSSPPVSVTIDALKDINSGQEYDVTVHLVSNSPYLLKNLLLSATYPFGFAYKSSNPSPVSSSTVNVWNIGDLEPGGERDITIRGVISGSEADERVFNISLGIADDDNPNMLGTVFLAKAQTVNISNPFLATTVSLDGDSSPSHTISIGKGISGIIYWQNTLPTVLNDASLVLKLTGPLLDETKISASDGFYDSETDSITWNKLTDTDFENIPTGGSGQVNFDFGTIDDSADIDASATDQSINLELDVAGTRLSEADVPENLTAIVTKTVKIASTLALDVKAFYSIGPFTNTGPIPPKVGTQTSYTVTWTLSNSFNDVTGAEVTATLPIYMSWLGTVSPQSESGNMSYNSNTHTITWNIGNIAHATGYGSNAPRQVSFQVAFTPSVSQVGASPVLVNEADAQGTDSFTGQSLSSKTQPVTAELQDDPGFTSTAYDVSQ